MSQTLLNNFLSKCQQVQFRPDESLVMAIILNNVNFVDYLLKNNNYSNIKKVEDYYNVRSKLNNFMDLIEEECFLSIEKGEAKLFFPLKNFTEEVYFDVFDKYKTYVSLLTINSNNSSIIKVLLDNNFFEACDYPLLSQYYVNCFDNFFEACLGNNNYIDISIECLYKGMTLICEDGVERMLKFLKKSKYENKIISLLYLNCLFKNYKYGSQSLCNRYPEYCNDSFYTDAINKQKRKIMAN